MIRFENISKRRGVAIEWIHSEALKHHFFAAVFARNQHRVEGGYAEKHYLLKYLKKKGYSGF